MSNISQCNTSVAPTVLVDHDQLFVTSENVAEVFGKEHKHVLRDIEKILSENDDSRAPNFGLSDEIRDLGFMKKKFKVYRLTRDGLMFLVMGYTGKKANALKWAYIDEFNRMEKELRGEGRKTITPEQQFAIREAVNALARRTKRPHQSIYPELYRAFDIPRYTELLEKDFPAAMIMLGAGNRVALETNCEEMVEISRDLLLHIAGFVYEVRYLHRPMLDGLYQFLRAAKSPMAGSFYEFATSMKFARIETHLKRHGMDVKDLFYEQIKHLSLDDRLARLPR